MKRFEIMFSDLNDEAKKKFLEFSGCENETQLNTESVPLAIIELEDE
jgi:hypothetical protein